MANFTVVSEAVAPAFAKEKARTRCLTENNPASERVIGPNPKLQIPRLLEMSNVKRVIFGARVRPPSDPSSRLSRSSCPRVAQGFKAFKDDAWF